MSENIEPHRVKCKSHRSDDVLRMVTDELKKLLDIRCAVLVQLGVVDEYDDLLKIVLFLLPLEFCLCTLTLVLAEIFVEYAHGEMLEVVLLNEEIGYLHIRSKV